MYWKTKIKYLKREIESSLNNKLAEKLSSTLIYWTYFFAAGIARHHDSIELYKQIIDKIDDSFKKIVITKDIVQPYYDDYGILTVNIYDFLLDPQILEK